VGGGGGGGGGSGRGISDEINIIPFRKDLSASWELGFTTSFSET
jgi:hypothetical protein